MICKGAIHEPEMNRTEAAYAQELELRRRVGEIAWWRFEGWKFRLADACFYTPDFAVMMKDGTLEAHEVKGFFRDDAKVKIKVAAEMYPLRFFVVRKIKGGFSMEVVGNG